jgi:hypothetical protein
MLSGPFFVQNFEQIVFKFLDNPHFESVRATRESLRSIRRSRHWPLRMPISISTMFNQQVCFGVGGIRGGLGYPRASAGGRVA